MLRIQKLASLAEICGFSVGELRLIAEFSDSHIEEKLVWDLARPLKKPRPVIQVSGDLRKVQDRLYQRRLKTRLSPSKYSYGGVAGRDITKNIRAHLGNKFGYKTDISAFYPSITNDRVCRLFLNTLGCSPEVSRFLTRFCTYEYHLALGLVTSPILADQILRVVDEAIGRLCARYNLTMTRFVDDIMVSGNFDIESSSIPEKIAEILKKQGFKQNSAKCMGGRLTQDFTVTGLRAASRRVDISKEFICDLDRVLADHASLARGGSFIGPYLSESQIAGKVNYVTWVNPNRKFGLSRRFKSIRWNDVAREAQARGLVFATKIMTARDAPRPAFERCFGEGKILS